MRRNRSVEPQATTILHIEDERLFRELISIQVQSTNGARVRMLSASNGTDGIALFHLHRPELVILDLHLPDLDGFALAEILRRQPQPPRILLLTGISSAKDINRVTSLQADGIARKGTLGAAELAYAIREILAGRRYIQMDMWNLILANKSRTHDSEKVLSDREIELLAFFGVAMSDLEIALIKGLSSETVRTHRQNIMRKLGLHSLGELVRWAITHGYANFETDQRS